MNTTENQKFGTSVALSESGVVIGSPYEDNTAGEVNEPTDIHEQLFSGAVYTWYKVESSE